MEDAEVHATLALSLVPAIGSQRLRTLIATFGSAQAALEAPRSKLASVVGIGPAAATAITEARGHDGARVLEQLAAKPHVVVLTKSDLRTTDDARRTSVRTEAGAPMVEISAVAKQGIPELLELLWKMLKSTPH